MQDQEKNEEGVTGSVLAFLKKWTGRSRRGRPAQLPESEEMLFPGRFRESDGIGIGLFFLKSTPLLALFAFTLSFFFDFSGTIKLPFVEERSFEGILRTLSVSALIGFGTNWIAIQMLFHPRQKRPLLGQGLIPSEKEKIVSRISDFVGSEIVNSSLIEKELHDSGFIERFRKQIHEEVRVLSGLPEFREDLAEISHRVILRAFGSGRLRRLIAETVAGLQPTRSMGIGGAVMQLLLSMQNREKIAERIEAMLESVQVNPESVKKATDEILDTLPERLEGRIDSLEEGVSFFLNRILETIDVSGVVKANLSRFDEARLEDLFKKTTSDQLDLIQYLGCVIGMMGGVLIRFPIWGGILFGAGFGMVYLLDRILGGPYSEKK